MSEERKKHISHLKAMLRCCERVTSGTGNCGDDCDNCELQYAKGNMGEIKDTLAYAISSLETDEAYQLEYEKPEICEDCISRADVLKLMQDNWYTHNGDWAMQESIDDIRVLPSVTPQEPIKGNCKDCKYFEYDSVSKIDGVPLIVAHEICSKWGNGCKTNENGYCFLFKSKSEVET